MATFATFEQVVRNAGLKFLLIQGDPREGLSEDEHGLAAVEGGGNPLRSLQDFARLVTPAILQTGIDSWAACQEMDMILYAPTGAYVAGPIAEKLNVPAIGCYLQPIHRTRAFPSMALPGPRNLGPILNRLTYLLTEFLWWAPHRPAVNQFRQEKLNLRPIPWWVNSIRQWQQHSPVISGFSSHTVSSSKAMHM